MKESVENGIKEDCFATYSADGILRLWNETHLINAVSLANIANSKMENESNGTIKLGSCVDAIIRKSAFDSKMGIRAVAISNDQKYISCGDTSGRIQYFHVYLKI